MEQWLPTQHAYVIHVHPRGQGEEIPFDGARVGERRLHQWRPVRTRAAADVAMARRVDFDRLRVHAVFDDYYRLGRRRPDGHGSSALSARGTLAGFRQ